MTAALWADWLGLLGKRRTLARWRELSGDRFGWMRRFLRRTGAHGQVARATFGRFSELREPPAPNRNPDLNLYPARMRLRLGLK